jgi:hypothetical protein
MPAKPHRIYDPDGLHTPPTVQMPRLRGVLAVALWLALLITVGAGIARALS